jgi:hypothetical protein
MMTQSQIRRQVANRLYPDAGCSDGGCVFGHAGGMRTNGGCACLKERETVILRRTVMRLGRVAQVLACMVEFNNDEA